MICGILAVNTTIKLNQQNCSHWIYLITATCLDPYLVPSSGSFITYVSGYWNILIWIHISVNNSNHIIKCKQFDWFIFYFVLTRIPQIFCTSGCQLFNYKEQWHCLGWPDQSAAIMRSEFYYNRNIMCSFRSYLEQRVDWYNAGCECGDKRRIMLSSFFSHFTHWLKSHAHPTNCEAFLRSLSLLLRECVIQKWSSMETVLLCRCDAGHRPED
jgi:hypothetical protein